MSLILVVGCSKSLGKTLEMAVDAFDRKDQTFPLSAFALEMGE